MIKHRRLTLLLVAVLSIGAALGTTRLRFDSDIEIWFLKDDASLLSYKRFLERFDADQMVVLAVFAEDVFAPEMLMGIDRLTRAAADAAHAYRVQSLTNVKVIESRGPLAVRVAPLISEPPQSRQTARKLRQRVLQNELLRDVLVSSDAKATAVVVEIDPSGTDLNGKRELNRTLREAARKSLPPGTEFHLVGVPVLDEAVHAYSQRDFAVLLPVSTLIVFAICLCMLRKVLWALLPLATVALANLWTFGAMGWLGLKIDLLSGSLFAVLMAVGVADTVHIVTEYLHERTAGRSPREAARIATESLLLPCLFTSLTTAAGFLALATSHLQPVARFGWMAAVGVAIAFALSVTFVPALLSWIDASPSGNPKRVGAFERVLDWLARPSLRRSRVVSALSVAVLMVAIFATSELRVGANPMTYFPAQDAIRTATERVDQSLGGTTTLEFAVDTPPGGLKDAHTLRRLDALARKIESLPAVTRVSSVLDALRETRRLLEGKKPAPLSELPLPDTPAMAAQLYLFLEGDESFRRHLLGDYETTRMSARVRLSDAGELTPLIQDAQAELKRDYYDDELRVQATGYIKLMGEMEQYLLKSQIRSLALAFVAISSMICLLLRSVRLALLSLVPNVVPVILGLAFMSVADIALDPGTVMIGSIVLGLVVDDTVHFLVRLRRHLKTVPLEQAIERAMRQSGRAIVYTSIILAAGFSVLTLGSFAPNIAFGMVSALVICLALVADLVVLPAILLAVRPRFCSATAYHGEDQTAITAPAPAGSRYLLQ